MKFKFFIFEVGTPIREINFSKRVKNESGCSNMLAAIIREMWY